MKLLNLVYIAHGFTLALNDVSLIFNEINAWPHGPFILDLYDAVKSYGSDNITNMIKDNNKTKIDDEFLYTIKMTYIIYKKFDGLELSNLTNRKGSPCDKIVEQKHLFCSYS